MRSLVHATEPLRMSPLFGPFSFSSRGRPSVIFPALLAARRPVAPARSDVAALGGLMLVAPMVGESGPLLASCFFTLSSSSLC